MSDPFRDSLSTDLGKSIYDWSPVKKPQIDIGVLEEIVEGFCTREGKKLLYLQPQGQEAGHVEIDGEHSIELHAKWRESFYVHGYTAPILICKDEDE